MFSSSEPNSVPAQIIGSFRYKDQLNFISIKSDSTLMEIYEAVIKKWDAIHPDALVLQFSAPRERLFVTLSCDEDVVNMVELHLLKKMKVVDIIVTCKDESNGRKRVQTDNWPMICLDGTHIKNKYQGCLLSAVCKDPNDELYTLAYAVVDAENDTNWEWFCIKFKQMLDYHNGSVPKIYTIFSDRHSGLLKAIPIIFPGSHHAYCLRHLVDNFRTQVLRSYPLHNKKHWAAVLHKAAYAPTRHEFEEHVSHIVASMPRAASFIHASDPNRWANAYFNGDRWGIMNNNQAECWNGWVKDARSLPVPSMIDTIRVKVMEMINNRREDSMVQTGTLCRRIEKRLQMNYTASRTIKFKRSTDLLFEVLDEDKTYAIDLQNMTCSCKAWQLEKIPCKHACACIESRGHSVFEFTDPCFRIDRYREVYQFTINPIPSFDEDIDLYDAQTSNGPADPFINAPDSRAPSGRRRTKRIPSQVFTRALKCKRCGKPGHNRRTCKQSIA